MDADLSVIVGLTLFLFASVFGRVFLQRKYQIF